MESEWMERELSKVLYCSVMCLLMMRIPSFSALLPMTDNKGPLPDVNCRKKIRKLDEESE